jgi:hypothetical protein
MEDDGYIVLGGEIVADKKYFRIERLVEETDDRAQRRLHLSALYWHHQRRLKEAEKAMHLALGVGFGFGILIGASLQGASLPGETAN